MNKTKMEMVCKIVDAKNKQGDIRYVQWIPMICTLHMIRAIRIFLFLEMREYNTPFAVLHFIVKFRRRVPGVSFPLRACSLRNEILIKHSADQCFPVLPQSTDTQDEQKKKEKEEEEKILNTFGQKQVLPLSLQAINEWSGIWVVSACLRYIFLRTGSLLRLNGSWGATYNGVGLCN